MPTLPRLPDAVWGIGIVGLLPYSEMFPGRRNRVFECRFEAAYWRFVKGSGVPNEPPIAGLVDDVRAVLRSLPIRAIPQNPTLYGSCHTR